MSPFNDHRSIGLSDIERNLHRLIQNHAPGYCGQMLHEHLDTGGKRLRAQVTLQLATLFSVDSENALQWASAVELLHNATLIHDDVQDGDTTRRNHPCTWVEHGIPQAINAGDLGLMLPFQCIEAMDIEDALRWRLSRILSAHSVRTVCGQSLEMTLLPNKDFSFNSYTNAALGKTGAFFALPMEGVAHLAGLSKKEREELVHLFAQIGLLFQMQDDVLDCFGNKGRMQGADLCEGKVSALVVQHLYLHPQDTSYFVSLLSSETPLSKHTIEQCIDIFAQSGALQLALTEIQVLEDDIYTSEILNSYPRLKVQVEMLLDTIMTPIQHLFERPLEMSQ